MNWDRAVCKYLSESAPTQNRTPQKGDIITDNDGNEVLDEDSLALKHGDGKGERHDFYWDGHMPPWGCMWCMIWRQNVLTLHKAGQQAVVVHQCAPDTKLTEGEWADNDRVQRGTHM